jgi:hypothetical protein
MDTLTYIKERYNPQLVAVLGVIVTTPSITLLAWLPYAASSHPAQAVTYRL